MSTETKTYTVTYQAMDNMSIQSMNVQATDRIEAIHTARMLLNRAVKNGEIRPTRRVIKSSTRSF